jgi:Alginate export
VYNYKATYKTLVHKTLLLLLMAGIPVQAQKFRLLRFDENYTYLKDSARSFYEQLKYTPIGNNAYLTLGGEARYEYVAFNNEDWGRLNIGHNNFMLQRYDIHADVHFNNKIRLFAQLRSALQDGRKNGPRGIDEDRLNIQNLFVDVTLWQNQQKKAITRLGRQELDYGSGRLISVNEGPNARLYFTGLKLMYTTPQISADAFFMMADTINTGIFDNKPTRQLNLWGGYAKIIIPKAGNIDLYYIGTRRDYSVFEEGAENQVRHTVGTRYWRYGGGFIYNIEAAYQFGTFGSGNISAWTASADLGYMFEEALFKPTINLRNDYISGDKTAGDGNLQTFSPIYPKGGYFGFNPQIGPVNLIDLHPYSTLTLAEGLQLQLDVIINWRFSVNDGIYRPSGVFNLAGSASDKKYIGTSYLAGLTYAFSPFINLTSGIQYFKTGDFLNDIIPHPKDGVFINARLTFKF